MLAADLVYLICLIFDLKIVVLRLMLKQLYISIQRLILLHSIHNMLLDQSKILPFLMKPLQHRILNTRRLRIILILFPFLLPSTPHLAKIK